MRNWKQTHALLLAIAVGFVNAAVAAEKPASEAKPKASEEEMHKKWMEAATPGAKHKALEPLIGEWNIECKFWMAGPDAPPVESKGTTKSRWILGDRFVQEEVTSEMMGMPFQGIGLTGYDNVKKKYVGSWVDNMGTAIFNTEGTADADGKAFTFTGKMDDIMTGEKDKQIKYTVKIQGPDKHTFEMHDLSLGAKSKTGEIVYTRK